MLVRTCSQHALAWGLKLAARVREPPPSPAEEEGQQHRDVAAHASSSVQEPGSNAATTGTAADGVPGTAGASPQYTDPSSMELTANFTPWVGEAMAPAPVKFPNQVCGSGHQCESACLWAYVHNRGDAIRGLPTANTS
eukprot:364513-Chlamydomonas_euryale.AAC.6